MPQPVIVTSHEHSAVTFPEELRPGKNRYRLECGQYIGCQCIHKVGSMAYCLIHGKNEQVVRSAISVWSRESSAYSLVHQSLENN